jgi:hypothetical protein
MLILMLCAKYSGLGRKVTCSLREWGAGFLELKPSPIVLRRQRAGRSDGRRLHSEVGSVSKFVVALCGATGLAACLEGTIMHRSPKTPIDRG